MHWVHWVLLVIGDANIRWSLYHIHVLEFHFRCGSVKVWPNLEPKQLDFCYVVHFLVEIYPRLIRWRPHTLDTYLIGVFPLESDSAPLKRCPLQVCDLQRNLNWSANKSLTSIARSYRWLTILYGPLKINIHAVESWWSMTLISHEWLSSSLVIIILINSFFWWKKHAGQPILMYISGMIIFDRFSHSFRFHYYYFSFTSSNQTYVFD